MDASVPQDNPVIEPTTSSEDVKDRRTIYISNVAPTTNDLAVRSFFNDCGEVEDVQIMGNPLLGPLYGFVQFVEPSSAQEALSLTNSELLGNFIKITLASTNTIPESVKETTIPNANNIHLITQIPKTPITNAEKNEEVARTVYIGNVNSAVSADMLMKFFSYCGPISFCRLAGDEGHPSRFAFIEFAEIEGAKAALALSGTILIDRPLKVNHSKNPIVKPPSNVNPREEDEIARKLRRIAERINKKCEEGDAFDSLSKVPSRSRSSSPRSRSSSRSPRKRNMKKRDGDQSPSREKRRKYKSRSRSRSRDRKRRHRSRSRSRDRYHRSSSSRRSRSKSRSRSRDRDRRRQRISRSRSNHHHSSDSAKRKKSRSRSRSRESHSTREGGSSQKRTERRGDRKHISEEKSYDKSRKRIKDDGFNDTDIMSAGSPDVNNGENEPQEKFKRNTMLSRCYWGTGNTYIRRSNNFRKVSTRYGYKPSYYQSPQNITQHTFIEAPAFMRSSTTLPNNVGVSSYFQRIGIHSYKQRRTFTTQVKSNQGKPQKSTGGNKSATTSTTTTSKGSKSMESTNTTSPPISTTSVSSGSRMGVGSILVATVVATTAAGTSLYYFDDNFRDTIDTKFGWKTLEEGREGDITHNNTKAIVSPLSKVSISDNNVPLLQEKLSNNNNNNNNNSSNDNDNGEQTQSTTALFEAIRTSQDDQQREEYTEDHHTQEDEIFEDTVADLHIQDIEDSSVNTFSNEYLTQPKEMKSEGKDEEVQEEEESHDIISVGVEEENKDNEKGKEEEKEGEDIIILENIVEELEVVEDAVALALDSQTQLQSEVEEIAESLEELEEKEHSMEEYLVHQMKDTSDHVASLENTMKEVVVQHTPPEEKEKEESTHHWERNALRIILDLEEKQVKYEHTLVELKQNHEDQLQALSTQYEDLLKENQKQQADALQGEKDLLKRKYLRKKVKVEKRLKQKMKELEEEAAETIREGRERMKVVLGKQHESLLEGGAEPTIKSSLAMCHNTRMDSLRALEKKIRSYEMVVDAHSSYLQVNQAAHKLNLVVQALEQALQTHNQPIRPCLKPLESIEGIARGVVMVAVGGVKEEVLESGVYSYEKLQWRFKRVARECRRAALVGEEGNIASHALAVLVDSISFKEKGLVEGEDTPQLLSRAHYYLHKHDLYNAVKEVNKLQGIPKELAMDWIHEAMKRLTAVQLLHVCEAQQMLLSTALLSNS